MRQKQIELMEQAISELLRIFTINERMFPPAEGRAKYNALDFATIAFIAQNPQKRLTDVAAYLGVSLTTAQSVADRLVKRGLVSKSHTEVRGRAVSLTLTKTGQSLRQAIHRQNKENCRQMLKALPLAEQDKFVQNLKSISDTFIFHPENELNVDNQN